MRPNHSWLPASLHSLTVSILLTTFAPASADAAEQCINQNAPAPLEICVQDDTTPGVWVLQPNGRTYQYFSSYSWGSVLWLNGADTTQRHFSDYPSGFGDDPPTFTPVSNTTTGTGTAADPYVITTVVDLGSSGVRLTQRFTYVNGDRSFRKTWSFTNGGNTTYDDLRFFHGGDTYFGGEDSARSWYDAVNKMVYVTNQDFSNSGYMGFFANPATPSSKYFSGSYYTGAEEAATAAELSNTEDDDYTDAGYQLQWNRDQLAPGRTWTIEAFEYWSPPGALQTFAPADDYAIPGSSIRKTFRVQNLDADNAMSIQLAVQATNGWTATLEGSASITLDPLGFAEVPVNVVVPADAPSGSSESITLTATSAATSTAAMRLTAFVPEYTIAPASLSFQQTLTGQTHDLTVQVANGAGAAAVSFGTIPSPGAPYSIAGDSCSGETLAAGESCSITVRFAPSADGTFSGVLHLPVLAPIITSHSVALFGSASSRPPQPVFEFDQEDPRAAPEPLSLSSTALFTTMPATFAPKAYDHAGTEISVELLNPLDRYPPGEHVLTWRAQDADGNVTTVQQILRVWPTVSFGPDITIGGEAGNHAFFRISLNGRSPTYPLVVEYAASGYLEGHDLQGGSVIFQEGEVEKQIGFAILSTLPAGTPERQVQVTFSGDLNRGSERPLTVTITSLNVSPAVQLALSQSGDDRTVVARDAGPVTLSLDIDDPNSQQTHNVQWVAPSGAIFTTSGNTLTLQPGSLPAGVHRFEVIVTDNGAPPAITRSVFDVVVRETAPVLPAGATRLLDNGMPDLAAYTPAAPNVLPEREQELHHYLMEADPGTTLALGAYSQLRAVYQTELLGAPAANEWPADATPNVGGYFDFVIGDLPRVGDSVNIVIPQRAAIPARPVYRKLNMATKQWQDFVENVDNRIASAPGAAGFCPPPSSSEYRAGLNPGDWCVRLTIEDGGPNDSDGQANGSVVDPGGVGVLSDAVVTGKSKGGGGSFDLWTLLAALGVFTLRTLQRHKRQAVLGTILGLIAVQASASDVQGWYAGLQAGSARSDLSAAELTRGLQERGHAVTARIEDQSRSAWRVYGGYQWARFFAAEAGYLDLGAIDTSFSGAVSDVASLLADANDIHPASAEGLDLAFVARYPLLPRLTVHARAGAFVWETETSTDNIDGQRVVRDKDGIDPLIGAGFEFELRPSWRLNCEWVRYELGDSHVGFTRAGIVYQWH
jgi:OmpA-like transmembrane domain